MKVFLSWSGDLSKGIAEVLRDWMPSVLQYVRPYFSPNDIEKGTKWSSEIAGELECSDFGIICLTKDNVLAPWILFEAGALSKRERSNVCTLLFGIEPTDVSGPLGSFQHTKFQKEDFKKLVESINSAAPETVRLTTQTLNNVFDMWWSKLDESINEIMHSHKTPKGTMRKDRDLLEEILEIVRVNSQKGHSNISRGALRELFEIINELVSVTANVNVYPLNREIIAIIQKLERPLHRLCVDSNNKEVYERIRDSLNKIGYYSNGMRTGLLGSYNTSVGINNITSD